MLEFRNARFDAGRDAGRPDVLPDLHLQLRLHHLHHGHLETHQEKRVRRGTHCGWKVN